jgi:hypothetical protein
LNGRKSVVVSAPPSLAIDVEIGFKTDTPLGSFVPPLPVRGVAAYAARIRQLGNCREKIATRLENASMPNMPPYPTLLPIGLATDPAPSVALFRSGS